MQAPIVKVGIVAKPTITLILSGHKGPEARIYEGEVEISALPDGKLSFEGKTFDTITFSPQNESDAFTAKDVVIGVNFHWQREEDQKFAGSARLINNGEGKVQLINDIDVESYLKSVISSEMSAKASLELLKAHAVISRGWLYAQIDKSKAYHAEKNEKCAMPQIPDEFLNRHDLKTIIKWYDRDDHTQFDVCADDHCQRYQGITRQTTDKAVKAVDETAFQVLTYDGRICDTRFSKSCGGVFEEFQYCWDDTPHPYLTVRSDTKNSGVYPDLTKEEEAVKWIKSSPEAFCNCNDKEILSQVLNDYDQETAHFYRWEENYTQKELGDLLLKKSGIDFGVIRQLKPLSRGTSGRITALLIEGSKVAAVVGKELEIRRYLSESHLYSSAFTVDYGETDPATGAPSSFKLTGAGWGHGVGLCQIGAAVMGAKGYGYKEILAHYFPGAVLKRYFDI